MTLFTILWKNIKWRFHNKLTIIITLTQPVLWLVLYSAVAGQTLQGTEIGNYTAFILPGLMVLVSFSVCSSSGIMNYMLKAEGSFYRILIAPVQRTSVILGQILEGVLCTFLEVGLIGLISLFFSVRFRTGISGFCIILLLIFLTAFFMSGICYGISLILPNEMVYESVMNAIVLPVFFLSSALFPVDRITGILKILVSGNPFTHVINSIRSILLGKAVSGRELVFTICLLLLMGGLGFCFAAVRLNRETDL